MESLIILAILAIYFIPTGNAISRTHKNAPAIACTNILLGWTGIFWIAALIWSFTDNTRTPK